MRSGRSFAWSASVFVAVTLTFARSLLRDLAHLVPSDLGDPLLNTWILWWNAHAVPLSDAWWNAPAFFPARDTLALSEHLAGLSILTTPVMWAGASPLVAYNLAFLLTFVLSAIGGYALGYQLTRRWRPASLAACSLALHRTG